MLLKMLLASFAALIPFVASAVSSVGNGAGAILTEENPWFVGSAPVRYCVEMKESPERISRESAKSEIRAAIADWKRTLKTLKLSPIGQYNGLMVLTGNNVTTEFTEVACLQNPELKFLLGVSDERVDKVSSQADTQLSGLALRLSYDVKTGRGRGLVWINGAMLARRDVVTSTENKDRFFNIVLHELGHVFGFQHRHAGVMSSDNEAFGSPLQNSARLTSYALARLDWVENGEKVCGTLITNDDTLKDLFDIEHDMLSSARGCVNTKPRNAMVIELEILSAQNKSLGKFSMNRKPSGGNLLALTLTGRYHSYALEKQLLAHPFLLLSTPVMPIEFTGLNKTLLGTVTTFGDFTNDNIVLSLQEPGAFNAYSLKIWISQTEQ